MSDSTFELNNDIQVHIERIGVEKTPLIMIDNFAKNPDAIVDYVCQNATFSFDPQSFYPGIRANLTQLYADFVLERMRDILLDTFEFPASTVLTQKLAYYSLITFQENELKMLQRIPHIDSLRPTYLAGVHYLNSKPHGGTGFFRHIPTGFETITDERHDFYFSTAKEFAMKNGVPLPQYITGSTNHYELIHKVDYKPNRLVFYPGHLLHSGLLLVPNDIDPNPATGRLTGNIFIDTI